MQRHLVLVLALALLAACGQGGGLFEMMKSGNAAQAELLDKWGLDCQIGSSKVNGRLASVTVAVAQEEVSDLTIDEVAQLIQPVIRRHFKEEPESLVISVTLGQ